MKDHASILAAILRDALDLPPDAPVAGLRRAAVPEWDSLRHVKIVLAIQKELGVRFSAAEVLCLASYEELLAALGRLC